MGTRPIWITGASGLLGRAVAAEAEARFGPDAVRRIVYSRTGPGRIALDLRDDAAVQKAFESDPPAFIVHAAAERRPDDCENEVDATQAINVDSARTLARLAREAGAWMIQISTDYVFDGTQSPYGVDAQPNPLNAYGQSKWDGAQAVLKEDPNSAVLRIPVLYGPIESLQESPISVIARQLLEADAGEPLVVDDYIVRYPTHTTNIAQVLCSLIEARQADPSLCAIFHWTGLERHTRFTMAQAIKACWDLPGPPLEPNPKQGGGAPRPEDAHLDRSRLERLGIGCDEVQFADALRAMLASYEPASEG